MVNPALITIFTQLRKILQTYEPQLIKVSDIENNYYLYTPFVNRYKKEVLFGAVKMNKMHVSYYLMPVYYFPELIAIASDALKLKLNEETCFNFDQFEIELFDELSDLTHIGYEKYRFEKFLQ